jgi:NAD(P)-dependent dehydrogenase (short-subunit alcohol dehydrogenase family)
MSREVAIVTGGARGLGAAYVEGLSGAGFDVVVADLTETDFVTGQDLWVNGGRLFN